MLLENIKTTTSFKDFVPIEVEPVKNLKGKLTNKYLIRVQNDVFGLLSQNYNFTTSLSVSNYFEQKGFKLDSWAYKDGLVTASLIRNEELTINNISEQTIKLANILLNLKEDIKLSDRKLYGGIFFVNSYNGASKLILGSHITIKLNNYSIILYISKFTENFIHNKVLEIQHKSNILEYINKLSTISNLNSILNSIKDVIGKKNFDSMMMFFDTAGINYNFSIFDILLYLSNKLKVTLLLKVLNIIAMYINIE